MKIKEIIVVEGKDDTTAVKRAVDADTIETNGSEVSNESIEKIKLAQQTRGVIVFTDPDFPGHKIRQTIAAHVPECKHAFLTKEEALHKHGKGIGVEHASAESIRKALKEAHYMNKNGAEEISYKDLLEAGLIGGNGARVKREKLGRILRIGYTNGKQLYNHLMMFQISKEQFTAALKAIQQEEQNG